MTTVLICDDMAEFRRLVARSLARDSELQVIGEAGNGQEAIDLTVSLHPDVVLLDIQMPVKDGFQALEEIHRECPGSKVIMLSALSEGAAGEIASNLGAAGYIEKGTSPLVLVNQIKRLVDEVEVAT